MEAEVYSPLRGSDDFPPSPNESGAQAWDQGPPSGTSELPDATEPSPAKLDPKMIPDISTSDLAQPNGALGTDTSRDEDPLMKAVATAVKKLGQEVEKLGQCLPVTPSLDDDASGTRFPVFDHFVIVGIDPATDSAEPTVLYSHSAPGRPDIESELQGRVALPSFCFPSGAATRQLRRSKSDSDLSSFMFGHTEPDCPSASHVFQFSGLAGNLYGVCVYNQEILQDGPSFLEPCFVYPPPKSQKLKAATRCYCFLTRVPVLPLLFSALYTLLDRGRLLKVSLFAVAEPEVRKKLMVAEKKAAIQMLDELAKSALPYRGGQLRFKPFEDMDPILATIEPYTDRDMSPLMSAYGVHVLLGALSLDSFVFVLMSVLLERRVLFVSSCPGMLSAAVVGFVSLLKPLEWQSMFVPILPPKLHHFFEAPVPFLVGAVDVEEGWKSRVQDAVWVHLEEDRVEGWNLAAKDSILPAEQHLKKALRAVMPAPTPWRELLQSKLFRGSSEQLGPASAVCALLRDYIRSLVCRVHQRSYLSDNPFGFTRHTAGEASFLDTLAGSRMMCSYFEEGGALGPTNIQRTAAGACRTLLAQRQKLAEAHGELGGPETPPCSPGGEPLTSPLSGLELRKEDSFLRQLAQIERGDQDPSRSVSDKLSRSMRKASRRTASAVSDYKEYIRNMTTAAAPGEAGPATH